jgi:hypothetical protein
LRHIRWILILVGVFGLLAGTLIISTWLDNSNSIIEQWIPPEQLSIRNIEFISNNSANVTIHNSATHNATIMEASVNGTIVTLKPCKEPTGTIQQSTSANFLVTLQNQTLFRSDETYKFELISERGTTLRNVVIYSPTP